MYTQKLHKSYIQIIYKLQKHYIKKTIYIYKTLHTKNIEQTKHLFV
jgi:hypothetical protein